MQKHGWRPYHEVPNGPVEDGPVVVALLTQADKVLASFWNLNRKESHCQSASRPKIRRILSSWQKHSGSRSKEFKLSRKLFLVLSMYKRVHIVTDRQRTGGERHMTSSSGRSGVMCQPPAAWRRAAQSSLQPTCHLRTTRPEEEQHCCPGPTISQHDFDLVFLLAESIHFQNRTKDLKH